MLFQICYFDYQRYSCIYQVAIAIFDTEHVISMGHCEYWVLLSVFFVLLLYAIPLVFLFIKLEHVE